jgi:outer membrane protein
MTLVGFLLLFSTMAYSQLKIGWVDSEVILRELPEAQKVQTDLTGAAGKVQTEVERMKTTLNTKYSEYQQKQGLMTDQAKQTAQQELVDMQNRILQYQKEKSDSLALLQQRMFKPVRDKIIKAIDAVAKEETFNFIFDKGGDISIVLYGDPRFNLTYKVLDKLGRGK